MKKTVEIQFRLSDDGPEVMINEFGVTIWSEGQSVNVTLKEWDTIALTVAEYETAINQINGGK